MKLCMQYSRCVVMQSALIIISITLFGCTAALSRVPAILTTVPLALRTTTSVEAAGTVAMATFEAALHSEQTPSPPTLTAEYRETLIADTLTKEETTPTPNLTATAEKVATDEAAVAATLTALAPTPTGTPTPDLPATATAIEAALETAIAATLTAITPTPDLTLTEAARIAEMQTAIAATLTAQPTFTPDLVATQTMQAHLIETMVAATLTAQPTPTPLPPTNTPLPPPTSTPLPALPPTNTPLPPVQPPPQPPTTSGFFRGTLKPVCTGDRNMTWFEGTVYVNGQPANGYQVAFKSYLVEGDAPATTPAVSGPHDGYTNWPNGYYSHIVNDYFVKKHLEIWIIDNNRQAISDRIRWDSDGPDGPCNKAVIDFSR